jgi:hypothetical protein
MWRAAGMTAAILAADPIYTEVRQFHDMGGELMFGTDVGYMPPRTNFGPCSGPASTPRTSWACTTIRAGRLIYRAR